MAIDLEIVGKMWKLLEKTGLALAGDSAGHQMWWGGYTKGTGVVVAKREGGVFVGKADVILHTSSYVDFIFATVDSHQKLRVFCFALWVFWWDGMAIAKRYFKKISLTVICRRVHQIRILKELVLRRVNEFPQVNKLHICTNTGTCVFHYSR